MLTAPRWTSKFQIKAYSWVFVPTKETVEYGKLIKKSIEECWVPPSYYFHLRDGGHVRALESHKENTYFMHLDIKNFFGNINKSRVTRCLKEFFPYVQAREVAVNSTVRLPESEEIKFILPFGFVQSPIIASVCLRKSKLGKYLHRLTKQDLSVSVYMDDIIISGNNKDELSRTLDEILVAADRSKLPLNAEKTEGPADKITAFNIVLSKNNLEITDDRFSEFQESYNISENENQKIGILGYVASVNSTQATML